MIYFSYGMLKSGSTFAFELTKEVFRRSGARQVLLTDAVIRRRDGINFMEQLTPERLRALEQEVWRLNRPMVVKTHGAAIHEVHALLEQEKAMGHCTFRDPRDMVVSLLDAGVQARRRGYRPFSEIHTIDDAMAVIARQMPAIRSWLDLPNILPIYYDDLAFHTIETIRSIAAQVGVTIDPERVRRAIDWREGHRRWGLLKPYTQFNKGLRDRYKTELSPAQIEQVSARFGDLLEIIAKRRISIGLTAASS
ncbi:MAG: sulfotransferase [Vicinamibacteria bacterium]|nr:sulfotransferase [Vicinamibacteria bacterium]